MGDGDELHGAQFGAEKTGNVQPADGQVGDAFEQHFLDPGEHFLAQPHAAAAALRHERGKRAHQPRGGVGGIDHQTHFGFPALLHVVGEVFELAGLLDQLPRAAQQNPAGLGEYRAAAVDAQQRHAELFLHACDRVAHRRLRAVQDFGGLGEAAVVDHGLQGAPLIKGDAGRFHPRLLLS